MKVMPFSCASCCVCGRRRVLVYVESNMCCEGSKGCLWCCHECYVLQILSGNSSTGSLGAERAVGEECGSLHLALSAGETHECSVVLHNVSSQPVEELNISLESKMDKDLLHQVRGRGVSV